MGSDSGCCYSCFDLDKGELCGSNHKTTKKGSDGLLIWELDVGLLFNLGMLHQSNPRGPNGFTQVYERKEVEVVVHQSKLNDDSKLKLMGNVIQWDWERGFYWSVTFSSPLGELLIVSVLIFINNTLNFSCMTASSVTYIIHFSL